MNYTNSGQIAVGAPMSIKRIQNEIEFCEDKPVLFLTTDEGNLIFDRFAKWCGCEPKEMDHNGKVLLMIKNENKFNDFIIGVKFGFKLNER